MSRVLQLQHKIDMGYYFVVKETWRLQGFEDCLFEKAKEAGMSDSQLYRQAGNAVTVNVVYEIGRKLKEMETVWS